jgi:hypothetical protein
MYLTGQAILIICHASHNFSRQTPIRIASSSISLNNRRNDRRNDKRSRNNFLKKIDIFLPILLPPKQHLSMKSLLKVTLAMTPVMVAFLASFGSSFLGTLLEILGVYRSCLCQVPTRTWATSLRREMFNLPTDTQEARNASKHWSRCGYTAIVFMVIITYVAWWYQKFLKKRFDTMVECLLETHDIE